MVSVTMKELLEAGVHFGHQKRRWNPRMKSFIFTSAQRDLHHRSAEDLAEAARGPGVRLRGGGRGGTVLFVGTKRQAQEPVVEEAKRCGMYYVDQRWLGGTLTNFATIRKRINRLK